MKRIFLLAVLTSPLALQGCGGNEPPPAAPRKESRDDKDVMVLIDTSKGPIKAKIFVQKAPISAANFLKYVDDKFYDGTIFHRVIEDFMIQGGGMEPGMKEKKTRDKIKNESDNGLKNVRGTLAMARTDDPDSATSQFFINVKDNPSLDPGEERDKFGRGQKKFGAPNIPGYSVFGKVTEGMDVVDAIRYVKTQKDEKTGQDNVPVEDVIIKSIRRLP